MGIDYEKHFFEKYNEFLKTSETSASPNRLNNRYLALIDNNKKIIENSSILDLGSHDGRWSFAAIKNGAKIVLGIEGRKNLVSKSYENMKKYKISSDRYNFVEDDIFHKLKNIKPKEFDVVFCFGIFYHIMNHMLLLSEIKRIQAKYLILDTAITTSNLPIILMNEEKTWIGGSAIPDSSQIEKKVIVGMPSKPALEMMLRSFGFNFDYYDWKNSSIEDHTNLEDYLTSKPISRKKARFLGGLMKAGFSNNYNKVELSATLFHATKRISLVAKNLSASV